MTSDELRAPLEVYLGRHQALGYERSSSETRLLRQLVDFISSQAPTGPNSPRFGYGLRERTPQHAHDLALPLFTSRIQFEWKWDLITHRYMLVGPDRVN